MAVKLILFTSDAVYTTVLPGKRAGQIWLHYKDAAGRLRKLVAVEGIRGERFDDEGQWVMKSNACFRVAGQDGCGVPRVTLERMCLYNILDVEENRTFRVYVEPLTEDRKCYWPYEIRDRNASFRIGRGSDCDIRYACNMVSKLHATLTVQGGRILLTDNGSRNGTFVNGCAVGQRLLDNGDMVYVMGLQIIVTRSYLYINNPDGQVTIGTEKLGDVRPQRYIPLPAQAEEPDTPEEEEDFYYRSPRFKYDVDPLELKLDPPPAAPGEDDMPLLVSIGPSVTMGMASATTAVYSVVNALGGGNPASAIPSLAMGVGMLAGTLIWPVITKKYQKKSKLRKENAREEAYTRYLDEMEALITGEIRRQEKLLRENDQDMASCQMRVCGSAPHIWERTPKHTDFLRLRLGVGQLPLRATIQYPERRFVVEQDPLTERMYAFCEQKRWLRDVPICLPLRERFVSGIYAGHDELIAYARSLILQLVTLHCYDEVKLVVLYDQADEEQMSFLRWLPHTMNGLGGARYIATTNEEAKTLSNDLEPIIERRQNLGENTLEDELPYYVVLCLDKGLGARAEFLRALLKQKEFIHFSVVCMYERLKDLPKECRAVLELKGGDSRLTLLSDVCEPPIPFQAEQPTHLELKRAVKVLANTQVDTGTGKFTLPRKYTFLEMLDVGMVEHINLPENWRSNDPTKSLAAPIGIDRYGEKLCLDLHERAHGPHGLIAGMTGSGKSETIIAYILSMALRYHPQEVAFILIDYKGGGMAKAFENLPHTAGVITNLDGSAINRSLVSMQSELHRRERIFRDASRQHNISNIDIYKYQKLYREGKVAEPLPHLVIVSDEFAELKKDQPDFMTALTSTARVGRSLGVHLILATQKPGGVVDDQIRSNSRFRLCLKVQDKGDSSEMLGRPEAAALVDTGRFYLQVGNNEIFELGQSAWAGAAYHPAPKVIQELDDAISVVDTNGRIMAEVNTDRFAGEINARKQLDILCEYICRVSQEEGIPQWRMWLEPIPARICVDDLAEKYAVEEKPYLLEPIVGELDDPAHQRQCVLRLNLSGEGNTLVYGSAGSGKEAFLEALTYSLIRTHTPEEVNAYILDFGGETMTAFAAAPHVGDVVLSHETEKVGNLLKLLQGRMTRRKKLLAQFGGNLEQYNAQAERPEPNIVVMIHNFASFSELYQDAMGELNYLTREGTKYGIYFVLTCTGVNDVRFSMMQNFKNIYCLQMNNPADYGNVLGKTGNLLPEKTLGRGMTRVDKDSVLEFQTAMVTREENPQAFLRSCCAALAARYPGRRADGIPVLPEAVTVAFLSRFVQSGDMGRFPVGVEKESLEIAYQDFTTHPVHLALSNGQEWKPFTLALAELASVGCGVETHLIASAGLSRELSPVENLRVYTDREGCVEAAGYIFSQTLTRNNTYKTALAEKREKPQFAPMLVIIQSMAQLNALLGSGGTAGAVASDDTPMNRLRVAMEKSAREYGIYFLVAEGLAALTPFTSEKWYKAQVNPNDGLWLGNGVSGQFRLTVNEKPQGFSGNLPVGFGYRITGGTAVTVKFLQ